MHITVIIFLLGFVLLIKGADILVDGSSAIAKKFGLSAFFIGLTIVAFGTSAPELVVSALASLKGSSGISFGNIIGSNISNTLLILGVSAIVASLVVKKTTISKEIPFSLLAAAVIGLLVNDILINNGLKNELSRSDGLILILFFAIFIYYTFGISREKEGVIEKTVEEMSTRKQPSIWISIFMIAGGLAGLMLGGKWIVDGAIEFASFFGVSEALIGLTIVAVGTSLPELAASSVAAYKGKSDIAVGNVVGSNIFNLFWVLGISSIIRPIDYDPALNADIFILLAITLLLIPLIYLGRKNILGKGEGIFLLVIYIVYLMFLILRG
jgi:cation:H+ antiporter